VNVVGLAIIAAIAALAARIDRAEHGQLRAM
jgi:hypothetical protein